MVAILVFYIDFQVYKKLLSNIICENSYRHIIIRRIHMNRNPKQSHTGCSKKKTLRFQTPVVKVIENMRYPRSWRYKIKLFFNFLCIWISFTSEWNLSGHFLLSKYIFNNDKWLFESIYCRRFNCLSVKKFQRKNSRLKNNFSTIYTSE